MARVAAARWAACASSRAAADAAARGAWAGVAAGAPAGACPTAAGPPRTAPRGPWGCPPATCRTGSKRSTHEK